MSRGHFSRSSEISHLIAQVRRMTPEDVLEAYGIKFLPDGTIWDVTFEENYKNINEWAQACVDEENSEYDDTDDKYDRFSDEDD